MTANRDGAHVTSIWTDAYPDGSTETYNVTWVLRLQSSGWRIVGLSTRPSPDIPEIFLNFENPEVAHQPVTLWRECRSSKMSP